MKFPFMAGDNYIYSQESLDDLLKSVGLATDVIIESSGVTNKLRAAQERASEFEYDYFAESERFNSMTCEIQSVIEDMRANKGGTKKALADRLEKILDYYDQDYEYNFV